MKHAFVLYALALALGACGRSDDDPERSLGGMVATTPRLVEGQAEQSVSSFFGKWQMISWTQPGIGSHEKQELDEMIGTLVVLSENVFRFGERSCEDPPYQLTLIAKSSKHENAKQPHWAQARSSCWGTRSPPL